MLGLGPVGIALDRPGEIGARRAVDGQTVARNRDGAAIKRRHRRAERRTWQPPSLPAQGETRDREIKRIDHGFRPRE